VTIELIIFITLCIKENVSNVGIGLERNLSKFYPFYRGILIKKLIWLEEKRIVQLQFLILYYKDLICSEIT